MKGLYDKDFKSLKNEIEEDIRKWKDLPCIVKMAVLPKATYRFNSTSIKIPEQLFTDLAENNTKFHMGKQKIQDSQNNPIQ